MVTRAQATGIPTRITLAGDKKYFVSLWTQREYAEWEEWARATYRKRALEGVESMPDDLQREFTLRVHERASKITFISAESLELTPTPTGLIKVWWMSLRIKHPELTEERLGELFLHPDTDYNELAKLPMLGSMIDRKKKGGTKAQQKPKQRKKRR